MTERTERRHSTRRTFLLGSAAVLAAACTDPTDTGGIQASDAAPGGAATDIGTAAPEAGNAVADTATATAPEAAAATANPSTSLSWTDQLTAADFDSVPMCTRVPASSRGPFPTTDVLDRRDITDGYPGRPFRFAIRVLDEDCEPIPGAAVEIWHTDASGDYSEYTDGNTGKDEAEGTTFCRGIQTAGDDGIVEFHTLYPGWYDSRAIHIHTTVYIDGRDTLTAQLYFDEAYTEMVMSSGEYAQFGPPDTTWANDSVAGNPVADGTAITLMDAERDGEAATIGLINIGVEPR